MQSMIAVGFAHKFHENWPLNFWPDGSEDCSVAQVSPDEPLINIIKGWAIRMKCWTLVIILKLAPSALMAFQVVCSFDALRRHCAQCWAWCQTATLVTNRAHGKATLQSGCWAVGNRVEWVDFISVWSTLGLIKRLQSASDICKSNGSTAKTLEERPECREQRNAFCRCVPIKDARV